MNKKTEQAFHWITEILGRHKIPFVITGGFAAKIYGSPRPLNDIDIDIPDERMKDILEDIKPYAIFGPAHFKDERWDLLLATLNYNGQEIDISGGDHLKICDARTGKWLDNRTDFKKVTEKEIFGKIVPVIPKEDLVAYKSMLIGDHQLIDIAAITNHDQNK